MSGNTVRVVNSVRRTSGGLLLPVVKHWEDRKELEAQDVSGEWAYNQAPKAWEASKVLRDQVTCKLRAQGYSVAV